MSDDNQAYKEIYLIEARENLEHMNQLLVDLEQAEDPTDIVNNIFRIAHTFKGMSATMGYKPVANLTHTLETTLDTIRSGKNAVTSEFIDVLFKCMDALELMTDEIEEEDRTSFDPEEIISKLDFIRGDDNAKAEEASEKIPDTDNPEGNGSYLEPDIKKFLEEDFEKLGPDETAWAFHVAKDCQMASMRTFQITTGLTELNTNITRTLPPAGELDNIQAGRTFIIVLKEGEKEELSKFFSTIGETSFTLLQEGTPEEIGSMIKNSDAELEERSISVQQEKTKITKKTNELKSKNDIKKKKKKTTHIRVNLSHLDNLMNLIGELVINKGRLQVIAERVRDKDLTDSLDSVNRITSELQEKIMSARLIPLDFHFNRFPRMVRDLSRKLDKNIEFVVKGGNIELDRTVIDEIGDPLVHLLRNSVDHGVENAEERKASGKDPTGRIVLSASREKNTVVISVTDDGKGLDPEKLKSIAVKKGLITQEKADDMSEGDAQRLILQAGFSTAETVTDTSGRGVGMDAVSFALESIGGQLSVISEIGNGTTIAMTLPITMAIVQALLVKSGQEVYAAPLSSVREIIDMKDYPRSKVMDSNVIVVRNVSIPLMHIRDLINQSSPGEINRNGGPVVILEYSGKNFAIVVDNLLGQQEIVIKSFGKSLQGVQGFAGATILGDGSVILILDINSLLSQRDTGI